MRKKKAQRPVAQRPFLRFFFENQTSSVHVLFHRRLFCRRLFLLSRYGEFFLLSAGLLIRKSSAKETRTDFNPLPSIFIRVLQFVEHTARTESESEPMISATFQQTPSPIRHFVAVTAGACLALALPAAAEDVSSPSARIPNESTQQM